MIKIKLLIFITGTLLFFSCGKDDDGSNTSFSCTIDSENYSTDGLLAYGVKDNSNQRYYGVKGEGTNQEVVLIWVPANAKAGEVFTKVEDVRIDFTNKAGTNFSSVYGTASAKVTIDKVTATNASGTFEANLVEVQEEKIKVKISNGKFNVKFR